MIATLLLASTLLAQSLTPIIDHVPGPDAAAVTEQARQQPAKPAGPAAAVPVSISPWTDDKPVTHLFQNLFKDLRGLGTWESGGLLAAGSVTAAAVHPQDDNLAAWVQEQPHASYTSVGNAIGNGWTQVGGAFGVWAVGKAAGQAAVAHVGSDLIRAQTLNALLTGVTKIAVDRTRPDGGAESFPSGHTSATFATAAILQSHFGWGAGAAGYAVGSFVGWSRIRSNHHFLSDVVVGAAIGTMSGRAVARTHTSKWTVVPVKTPGGAAIVVTRRY